MRSSRVGRFVVLGLMLFILVAPAWGASFERQSDFLGRLWGALTGLWAEAGCIIDPHGGCGPTLGSSGPDEGCIIDPHGGCSAVQAAPPAPKTDEGCIIDPNGGCAPRS